MNRRLHAAAGLASALSSLTVSMGGLILRIHTQDRHTVYEDDF
jgi:hypothetical protein